MKPIFWVDKKDDKGKIVEILIDRARLLDCCSNDFGFFNYIDYSGAYILVRVTRKSIIKEVRIEELKQAIKTYLREEVKREDVWAEFVVQDYFTTNFIHLLKPIEKIDFNRSTKTEAHFYYQNGAVIIRADQRPQIIPYEEYDGHVWERQINNRDFALEEGFGNGDFNKFLKNISGGDERRYRALITVLGYILHPYKDPSNARALILLDEKADFTGNAHGGTGKSLIAKAISYITPTSWKDGKKYNPNETFAFDDVRSYHRVLYFDDVTAGFHFEEFFSFITGDIQVKRKYKDSAIIPFALAPKLIVSSNYIVSGTGGATDERRRIEFEVAPYYSVQFKPSDEFGCIFFDDWSENEWRKFDTLMLLAVHRYMRAGLIMPPAINLEENKLKASTHPDFVEFMDERHVLEEPLDKAMLLVEFIASFPGHKHLSGSKFKKWIDEWAVRRGLIADHNKSNGKSLVRFTAIDQPG